MSHPVHSFTLVGLMLNCVECVVGVELHELSGCEEKGCSHDCVEKAAGPTCTCPEDMVLGYDKEKCQGKLTRLSPLFVNCSWLLVENT